MWGDEDPILTKCSAPQEAKLVSLKWDAVNKTKRGTL